MKKNKHLKIMFAGASGTGKTTLAKFISEVASGIVEQVPYVSGSISDLLPETSDLPHKEMLSRDPEVLFREDYQVLNLRNKLFAKHHSFVSDRSFLDVATYFIYKLADKYPSCEIEQFLNTCLMCLNTHCTHLIFIPFGLNMFNGWVIEDNNKRITSKYFQLEISSLMRTVLDLWGYKKEGMITSAPEIGSINPITALFNTGQNFEFGAEYGDITSPYGTTRVIILHEVNLDNRKLIINKVIYQR